MDLNDIFDKIINILPNMYNDYYTKSLETKIKLNNLKDEDITDSDIIRETMKAFIFENVKGLSSMYQGQFLHELQNDFSLCGYDVHFKIINAFDYGVPQLRERVFLVGSNQNKNFDFPKVVPNGF